MRRVHAFRAAVALAVALMTWAVASMAQAPPTSRAGAEGKGNSDAGGTSSVMNQLRLGTMVPQTPITVLMAPAAQRELKLTDEQKNKVYELAITAGQKQRDMFQAVLFGGGGNPQAFIAARDRLRSENEQAIGRILDKKQQERMSQIVLQLEGPLAVSRPEIADQLRLNDAQREAVQITMMQLQRGQRQINMMARRQAVALSQLDPSQFGQVRAEMGKLRDAAVQQISKVIDRKQKAAFNKMLGEPFELSKLESDSATASDPAVSKTSDAKKDTGTESADPPASEKDAPKPKSSSKSSRRKSRTKNSAGS